MLDYKGFNEKVITVKCDEKDIAGKPMTILSDSYAITSPPGSSFIGFGIASRDGYATIQVSGYIEVQGSGNDIRHGWITVAADSEGGICANPTGMPVHVINYDYDTKITGIIF